MKLPDAAYSSRTVSGFVGLVHTNKTVHPRFCTHQNSDVIFFQKML